MEPLLDAYKPPGLIKKIYFRTLTFGDAPFIIDNIWIDKANDKEICLEVPLVRMTLVLLTRLPSCAAHPRLLVDRDCSAQHALLLPWCAVAGLLMEDVQRQTMSGIDDRPWLPVQPCLTPCRLTTAVRLLSHRLP